MSGEAADAGFEDVSRGEPGVQYALQTSIRNNAGRLPHPIRFPKPEADAVF